MADYTYDQLKESTELDKGVIETYKNSDTAIGKSIYNQAKHDIEANTVSLDEKQAAAKDKISYLEQQNELTLRLLNIPGGEYKAQLAKSISDNNLQIDNLKKSISDNNLQIDNLNASIDGATYSHDNEQYYEKTDEATSVELTAPEAPQDATYVAKVDDSLKYELFVSSVNATKMTNKFDNALEELTQDALNNAKVNTPKAADTKLDKDAAATVNNDFDVFADANIDSRNLQASYDDPAISKYIEDLNDDVAINHIFSNTFYRIPAVPHWAYSVDFIPTTELLNSIKTIDVYTLSKFLTKSVISLTLPAREMTSTVSNYKGLSVELPARAKTSGELSFTFAETESFIISEILEQLLKYARNDMFYEFDSTIIANYLSNTKNTDIKQYADNIDMMNSAIAAYRKFIENYAHEFNILVKLYRAADTKALGDTKKNEYPTFVYFFKGCDVASVKQFKLDYNSDKPIDIGASFMYQYFEEMTYEEYLLRYGGWNDGLDDPLLEASQEEMIAAAEASNPLTLVTHRDVYNVNLERS